jgi:hypothetical protein
MKNLKRFPRLSTTIAIALLGILTTTKAYSAETNSSWKRHTIDGSSQGADGVRLADFNSDGLLDIVSAWEEGNRVRAYLNPGYKFVHELWTFVTIGKVAAGEDAVFIDIDGDGFLDVVSASEGDVKTLWIHWNPGEVPYALFSFLWKTEAIPTSVNRQQWMYVLPMQIDGKHGVDLVAAGKNENAQIGWFEAPKNSHNLENWHWHPLYKAGWIMSLESVDLDRDGDLDIVVSDRKGDNRGCFWLENPGTKLATKTWQVHRIGGSEQEMMFLDIADLNADGLPDIIAATHSHELLYYKQVDTNPISWQISSITLPDNSGTGKSVAIGDIDLNGNLDIVVSTEHAEERIGVFWLSSTNKGSGSGWEAHNISGLEGSKFDLVKLIDLDGDRDLDVITSEEDKNLGVIWYENPTRD